MPQPTEYFLLNLCPSPTVLVCGYARYGAEEVHVTRYNHEYVLLFMVGGVLRFTENAYSPAGSIIVS